MNKMLIFTVIAVLLITSLSYLAGKWQTKNQTKEEIRNLRRCMADMSSKVYDEDQLHGLPEPVQRYFRYALKDGQPYVSSVFLKHDGQFKTGLDKEWINIEGEQYFSAEEPGFLWIGKTALFSVRDMYICGKGKIKVTLFNLFKLVNGEGPKYDQGELLRWLGESVWFPTNLLPGPRLQWSEVDDETADLLFRYKEQMLTYRVGFNEKGEITQLETRRYMGEEDLETWIGRVNNYEEIKGMKIPMNIEAIWKLADGEHSYARFNIRTIHHN